MNIKSCQIVFASDHEEFFYKENDIVVSAGQPVGVELELENEYKFVLFDDIYWMDEKEEKVG